MNDTFDQATDRLEEHINNVANGLELNKPELKFMLRFIARNHTHPLAQDLWHQYQNQFLNKEEGE